MLGKKNHKAQTAKHSRVETEIQRSRVFVTISSPPSCLPAQHNRWTPELTGGHKCMSS